MYTLLQVDPNHIVYENVYDKTSYTQLAYTCIILITRCVLS